MRRPSVGNTCVVANERLIKKLRQLEVVRRDLASLLVRLGIAIRAGISNLRRGVPVSEQTQEATSMHVELVQKLDEMHHAVHDARAEGVRSLVEDEGLPVSTVAQLMGRPRQLVSRLYQQARNGRGPGANGDRRGTGSVARARFGRSVPRPADPSAAGKTRIPPAAQ
jgi:hypothetical protein